MPIPHRLTVRVYYEDTDFSGVVYHASYLRFLERGRTEFLRALGIEHRGNFANGGADGFYFVVRAMMIDFLKPALMDDVLSISTQVSKIGGASIEMWQEIRRGDDALLTAKVRIAVVGGGKARRFPTEILAKLKTLAGSGPLEQGAARQECNAILTAIMAKSGTGSTHGAVARTWLGLALSPRNDRFPGQDITETGFDPQTLLSLNLNLEGIME